MPGWNRARETRVGITCESLGYQEVTVDDRGTIQCVRVTREIVVSRAERLTEIAVSAIVKDAAGTLDLRSPLKPEIARVFGAGELVTVIVRSVEHGEPKRTLDQSAFFYAEPLKKFMAGDPELAGCTPAHAKLILLGRFFGWEKVRDHWLPGKVSTADLTKVEFTGFIEFLIQDGAEKGINVVPPERDPRRRDPRVKVPA